MRLKPTARTRTIQRYVERHPGFGHNCAEIHCSDRKSNEVGCGMWL